jgi:hypothetical protein
MVWGYDPKTGYASDHEAGLYLDEPVSGRNNFLHHIRRIEDHKSVLNFDAVPDYNYQFNENDLEEHPEYDRVCLYLIDERNYEGMISVDDQQLIRKVLEIRPSILGYMTGTLGLNGKRTLGLVKFINNFRDYYS